MIKIIHSTIQNHSSYGLGPFTFISAFKSKTVNTKKVKKLIAIFFLVIYTSTAFGVVVRFHFCDKALNHASLSGSFGKCDCDSNSYIPMDCCKDKSICLKVNSRITTQLPFTLITVFHQSDLFPIFSPNHIIGILSAYLPTFSHKLPPQIPPKRIYLLDRVLRI